MDKKCNIKIKGECAPEQYKVIQKYADDLKDRNFTVIRFNETSLENGNIRVDYYFQLK